jgi:hypothetical protein
MKRIALFIPALMLSASIAAAQQNQPPAAAGNAPSSAPGQAKPGGDAAKDLAPGQTKGANEPARDLAPGRERDADKSAADKSDARGNTDAHKEKSVEGSPDRSESSKGDRSDKKAKGDDRSSSSTGTSAGTEGRDSKKAKPSLTGDQKTKLKSAFTKHHNTPAKNVDVSISVGAVVPSSVTVVEIPQDIVLIVPEYRGYRYFWIDDERVAIVDPDTLEVVDIIIVV